MIDPKWRRCMISDVIVIPFGRGKEDFCAYNISSGFHCHSLDTSEVTREEELFWSDNFLTFSYACHFSEILKSKPSVCSDTAQWCLWKSPLFLP